jgi:thiamine-monophosphate kinase
MEHELVLSDLGERKIVESLLPNFVSGVGDDCAILTIGDKVIAMTTDPVPVPAAKLIGGDPDLYWTGRLLVTINASDLAAGGAEPLAFLAAIDAPSSLPLSDFKRLLSGIADGCAIEGLRYMGGNLRESATLTGVGTAVGLSNGVKRTGATAGDIIVSVGAGGRFWRDALAFRAGRPVGPKEQSPLFSPRSQIKAMASMARNGLIRAAIDNSDGLLPSLKLLGAANKLSVELDLSTLAVVNHEQAGNIDPARLWLGWGDWNVIAAVAPADIVQVVNMALANGSVAIPIGTFLDTGERLVLRRGEVVALAPRLESERFVSDSWFTQGVERYIDALLSVAIP